MAKHTIEFVEAYDGAEIYNVHYPAHKRTIINDVGFSFMRKIRYENIEFPSITIPMIIGKISQAIKHDKSIKEQNPNQHSHSCCNQCNDYIEELKILDQNLYVLQSMGVYANDNDGNTKYRLAMSNYIVLPIVCLEPKPIYGSNIDDVILNSLNSFWNTSFEFRSSDLSIIIKNDCLNEEYLKEDFRSYYRNKRLLQNLFHHDHNQ